MIRIESNKIRWGLSAVLALLILFGTYHSIFSLAAFLICCLMIFFFEHESVLLQIFFILPMANIFKLAPGIQSFFTILILLYVVLHLILPRKATTVIIIFAVYVIIGELFAGEFNLFRTIKLICNILFLSSILNSEVKINHKQVFLSYIVGNIVASVFGMMDSSFFRIVSYIGTTELGNPEIGEEIYRFAGLYADPNYYAVGLIIALCLTVILFHRKEITLFTLVLFFVPMIYFLIQTYSKSAIIMLFLPLFVLLYSLHVQKKYLAVCILLISSAIIVILALTGQIPALNIVLARLMSSDTSEGVDVNALTTGRFELWLMYLKFLIKNIKPALFGVGISTALLNGYAAHNTYFDILYYLGAVGSFLLIYSLMSISAQSRKIKVKRNFMNYSVMICIVVMYFFLSELFYFDPPFQIFIGFLVLNLPVKNIVQSDESEMLFSALQIESENKTQ